MTARKLLKIWEKLPVKIMVAMETTSSVKNGVP